MKKKITAILLAASMLLAQMPAAFAAKVSYEDTAGHWAEAAIDRWSDYGVVQGDNGRFDPDGSLTRAQAATVFAKLLGLEQSADVSAFTDVPADAWYADAMAKCYAAGILKGVAADKMDPDGVITREMFFVMFARAMGIPEEATLKKDFADADTLSGWARYSVYALINHGYVNGLDEATIGGGRQISRASVMALLDQAISDYQVADGKPVITLKADSKQEEVKEENKPVSGGGSGGGSSSPSYSDLTIAEPKTLESGTYQNVTITDAVGNGEVTLTGLTIHGDLTVRGGGSASIKLVNCSVLGRIILDKLVNETSTQQPRLELTNTPVSRVEVLKPAILEAVDAASSITAVEASANLEVKGENTAVAAVTVPAAVTAPVAVTVTAGAVAKVDAKGEATVTGAAGSVGSVVAGASVTVDSAAVGKVEVSAAASAAVIVAVTGEAKIEVTVNSANGVAITGSKVTVSTGLTTAPDGVTVNGTPATHLHHWDNGSVTTEATLTTDGVKTYTCTGCDETKTEPIPHTATDAQLALISEAEKANLLTYLQLSELGETTRLQAAQLVAAYLNLPVTPAPANGFPFSDCAGLDDTARGVVLAVCDAEIMKPTGQDTFAPDGVMTRAQAAEVIYRMTGVPDATWTKTFSDVGSGHWAVKAINNLYNHGILTGKTATAFAPDDPVAKEDVLTWLLNAKNWIDPRPAVPVVTDFGFDARHGQLDVYAINPDTSIIGGIRYELKTDAGSWINCGTFNGSAPVLNAALTDGTYTRIRLTALPKNGNTHRSASAEYACDLTISVASNVTAAPAKFAVNDMTGAREYRADVYNLSPDTTMVVVELAKQQNGYGQREMMIGNWLSPDGAGGQNVWMLDDGGYLDGFVSSDAYYRVTEISRASVSGSDPHTAAQTMTIRGDWEKIEFHAVSEIKNIRFQERDGVVSLAWDFIQGLDAGSDRVRFRVLAQGKMGGTWNSGVGMPEIPMADPAGEYTSFTVEAIAGGKTIASAAAALKMTANAGTDASVASAVFTKTQDGKEYQAEITGLSGYPVYHIYVGTGSGPVNGSFGTVREDGTVTAYLRVDAVEASGAQYTIFGIKGYNLKNGELTYTIECLCPYTPISLN